MAFVAPPLPVVMLKLFPHVQSIVDESQALLQGATYSVRTGSEVIVGPGASVAAASQAGIDLPPGEYQLVISAAMFVDLEVAVSMRAASDRRKRQSFWMVPADNQARAVLRWHTTPLQLDFYVVPIATGIGGFPRSGISGSFEEVRPLRHPHVPCGVRLPLDRAAELLPTRARRLRRGLRGGTHPAPPPRSPAPRRAPQTAKRYS